MVLMRNWNCRKVYWSEWPSVELPTTSTHKKKERNCAQQLRPSVSKRFLCANCKFRKPEQEKSGFEHVYGETETTDIWVLDSRRVPRAAIHHMHMLCFVSRTPVAVTTCRDIFCVPSLVVFQLQLFSTANTLDAIYIGKQAVNISAKLTNRFVHSNCSHLLTNATQCEC